jgi:hypothetical protein
MNDTDDIETDRIDVDRIEVARRAHEIERRIGRDAWAYAARWAEDAARENRQDAAAFWRAVSVSLKPR